MDAKYPEAFMVSEWSNPESSLDAGFHADFFHWFAGYNDLLQKESWRILNGFSEGHSFFDREGKGNIRNFLDRYLEQYARTKDKGYILLPLGNHDVSRLNIRRTEHELEMIFAFSFAMPGIPFIRSKAASSRAPAPARRCSGPRTRIVAFPRQIPASSTCLWIHRRMRQQWRISNAIQIHC